MRSLWKTGAVAALLSCLLGLGCAGPRIEAPGRLRAQTQAPPPPFAGLLSGLGVARVRLSWDPSPDLVGVGAGGGYRVVLVDGARLDLRTVVATLPASATEASLLVPLPARGPELLYEVVAFSPDGGQSAPSGSGLAPVPRHPSGAALLHPVGTPDCAPSAPVRCVAQGDDGSLWMGTDGGGLLRDRAGTFARWSSLDGLLDDRIEHVIPDESGAVWLGGPGGLQRWTPATAAGEGGEGQVLLRHPVDSMVRDAKGDLWLVGGARLWRVPGGRGQAVAVDDVGDWLPSGNLLADLEMGAERLRWRALVERMGRPPELRQVALAPDGALWLGLSGGGLLRRGQAGAAWELVAPVIGAAGAPRGVAAAPHHITGLAPDEQRGAWVSDDDGLYHFSAGMGWRRFMPPPGASQSPARRPLLAGEGEALALSGGRIWSCVRILGRCRFLDASPLAVESLSWVGAELWLGFAGGTVERRHGVRAEGEPWLAPCREAAPVREAVAVAVTPEGRIWASDGSTVSRSNGSGEPWESLPLPAELTGAHVGALLVTPAGDVVVSTSRGFALWSSATASWTAFPSEPVEAPRAHEQLSLDLEGRVWSSAGGKLRYLDVDRRGVETLTLPAANLTVQALAGTADGQMWVGSSAGLKRLVGPEGELRAVAPDPSIPEAIEALAAGPGGYLWVAGGGRAARLHVLEPGAVALPLPESWGDDRVAALVSVTESRAALVSARGRILCPDVLSGEAREPAPLASGAQSVEVEGLALDGQGGGWLATRGRGLVLVPHLCR